VGIVQGPIDPASIERLQRDMAREPGAFAVVQLPGRSVGPTIERLADRLGIKIDGMRGSAEPAWISASRLRVAHRYALPNGRRYALLEAQR